MIKKALILGGLLLAASRIRSATGPAPAALPLTPSPLSQEAFRYPIWDPISNARLDTAHPRVAAMASELVYRAEKDYGIFLRITEAARSFQTQADYYAQGRTKPGQIITYAKPGESYHNYGLAVDVVEIKNGVALWQNPNWQIIGQLGKAIGFRWGGDFQSFKDWGHFETGLGYPLSWWKANTPQIVGTPAGVAPMERGAAMVGKVGTRQNQVEVHGRKYAAQVTPWFLPYAKTAKGWTRTNFARYASGSCGVYLIRSRRSGKILYVGYSATNLKKTIYRHFQSWDDPNQYRATYANRAAYEIMIITCPCQIAKILELEYIQKHQPRDNELKYQGSLFTSAKRLPRTEYNSTDPTSENYVPF